MRLEFQKSIASSQFTLPVVSILGFLLWVLLPVSQSDSFVSVDYGLWHLIPSSVVTGKTGMYVAIGMSALIVYLIAELTNTFVLLRISSRMLSSTMAFLLGGILCLHTIQPGHVLSVFYLLTLISIFYTYQMPMPVSSFLAYLFLSLSSLIFPKIVLLVPMFWICQIYLRAFSARCFVASLFGLLVPYWFFLGLSVYSEGSLESFLNISRNIVDLHMPQYASLSLKDILIFSFITLFFISGMVDFYINSYLDKTRSRAYYNMLIGVGFVLMIAIVLQPQYFHTILPLYLINTSFVGGHFIALTYNKLSHIYCLVMLALYVALLASQILL